MVAFYITCILFVVVLLGAVRAFLAKLSILKMIKHFANQPGSFTHADANAGAPPVRRILMCAVPALDRLGPGGDFAWN